MKYISILNNLNITVTRMTINADVTSSSRPVSPDDVPDGCPAEGALPSLGPLLHGALEAHAHVAAGVEDAVHLGLEADHALGGAGVRGAGLGPLCLVLCPGAGLPPGHGWRHPHHLQLLGDPV